MDVKNTTNYRKFKKIEGNRELNETKLKHIGNSILAHNLLEYNPIFVNESFEVTDGQHRLEVARRNKLTIYYVVIPNSGVDEIVALNTARANWTMQDFMNLWISRGKQDYLVLKQFCDKYGLSVSIALYLLADKSPLGGTGYQRSALESFKKGTFEITGLKRAIELADKLTELKPYLEDPVWKDRDFIQALRVASNFVAYDRIIAKMKLQRTKFQRQATFKEYLRALEDVCNFRARAGSQVWFH